MRVINRLIGFLMFVLLLGLAVLLLGASLSPTRWQGFLGVLGETRLAAGLVGGFSLLLVTLIYTISALSPTRRTRYLSFDEEGGTVSISTDAIAEYLAKLAGEFPSVVRMKPIVRPTRGAVDIVVEVHVKAGSHVHEVCELLQQRVRESVTTGLGITQVRRVEVSVGEIVSEHKPL